MKSGPDRISEEQAARRRIVRRATYYTLGFMFLAVVVAAAGSAPIAWFISRSGLPFRETWLSLTLGILIIPVLGISAISLWKRMRGRRGRGEERGGEGQA